MSAVHVLDPVQQPSRTSGRRLKVVPEAAPGRLARFPFILSLVALVALGMGGLVVVNTQIQTQASELSDLQQEATSLGYKQAQMEAEVNKLRSAASLEQQAHELGMRPNPNPAFIVLPEGRILGTPTPVTGKELSGQTYVSWDEVIRQQENARLQVVRDQQAKAEAQRRAAEEKRKADEAKKAADAKKKADQAASTRPSQSPAPSTSPSATP